VEGWGGSADVVDSFLGRVRFPVLRGWSYDGLCMGTAVYVSYPNRLLGGLWDTGIWFYVFLFCCRGVYSGVVLSPVLLGVRFLGSKVAASDIPSLDRMNK
jgi:hypothetical protein